MFEFKDHPEYKSQSFFTKEEVDQIILDKDSYKDSYNQETFEKHNQRKKFDIRVADIIAAIALIATAALVTYMLS